MRHLLKRLNDRLRELAHQVEELELQIKLWHKENESSQKLEAIPGIGPITASAIVATVGNATEFKNGRQLAAWLGLVPKQNSSGGKQVLLGISKRGDTYLRTLLIHGARAVIRVEEAARLGYRQGFLASHRRAFGEGDTPALCREKRAEQSCRANLY